MQITGTVISKIYQSADGYAVIEIAGETPGIVVGNMPHIKTGELTRFFGEFAHHPKYGRQFKAESYESTPPIDPDDMVLFLASDFVKGVGEKLAQRLVDAFGEDTFQVIEDEPERVAEVPGISEKVAAELQENIKRYSVAKYRYAELMALGLTAHQAELAEEALGGDAATQIKENPYMLAQYVRGIDFIRADKIADQLGIEHDSPLRVESAIRHVLNKSLDLGNMYVRVDKLLPHVADKLEVSESLVEQALQSLTLKQTVVQKNYSGQDIVFLSYAYDVEAQAAQKLHVLLQTRIPPITNPEAVDAAAARAGLSDEQTEALRTVLESNVCVITGGPGTGKTTILKTLLRLLEAHGQECRLAAPTGRAAKRMNEATGANAQTIHRLLEYAYDDEGKHGYFRVNAEEPLKADVVLVDEVSMVDAFLFRNLLDGVAPGTRLVLIGDADQLPSVGPGNVLKGLIASGVVPTVALTYHFRNEGLIANAAHDILHGTMPVFDDEQFTLIPAANADAIRQIVAREYAACREAGCDVQVIAPIKKTVLGSIELNNLLRDTVNPPAADKPQVMRGDRIFRQGDRVMQTSNDYERPWTNAREGATGQGEGVFNGDIGVIEAIVGGELEVRFDDGRLSFYQAEALDHLDGAFAYTIHKSQGNEFEVIIIPMLYSTTGMRSFLTRSLIYTAVTRAKQKVILVGTDYTLRGMIANDMRTARASALAPELQYLQSLMSAQGAEADMLRV